MSSFFHLSLCPIFPDRLSKGEIIVPTDVIWLKTELAKCIDYLNLATKVHSKTILSIGASSFSLNLPKKHGPIEQPRLYDRAIRDVIAIAHQMAVRWLLSDYGNPRKQVVIIIHAGLISEANLAIQPLIQAKLTGEIGIYLTDFAYHCARVAEVKVGLERYDEKLSQADCSFDNLWKIQYFWSYDYYDYIPYLLEKDMLPVSKNDPSYGEFQQALYFPEQFPESSFDALRAIYRFPQNSLLLIEIANVLRARQMPFEADEILSNLLIFDPNNIAARVMRMIIYSNIAQAQNNFFISDMAFEKAIAEGEFIVGLNQDDIAILSEFAAVYFNKAKKMIQYFRKNSSPNNLVIIKETILDNLQNAKMYFMKALAASATGKDTTSLFWLLYVMCYMEIVATDESFLTAEAASIDNNKIFQKIGNRFFSSLGWLGNEKYSEEHLSESAFQHLFVVLANMNSRHDNSMLARSYIPYTKYLFSVLLWDFAPHSTLSIYQTVLLKLNDALKDAEKLIVDNLSVYRITVNYISPDVFIAKMRDTINLLKKLLTDNDLKNGHNAPLV